MADLNKLLVKVPANLCDAFRTKYLTGDGSTPRDTSYDRKIVFLEDTKDIFSQGKIYGTSHAEFEELKNKIEDKSVTLTFGVSSFDSIREEGGPGSDAETHYDAVYKAYTNNGIVKIALNNGNSAILSNIEFENGITAMGDDRYTIKGTLCPNSLNGIVGNNKSYNITFRYDSGDPAYGIGYYVSCKEITDTLYNKKVGGTEIQGDSAGTFMETIDPGNDTLSTVLKQLLTNDVLLEAKTQVPFIDVENFEFNITGGENSRAKEYFDKISNAHGNIIFIQSNGSHRAKSSNIEFKREVNPENLTNQETYICTLCSPVSLSADYDGEYYNKYYCAIFVKNENNYTAKCQEISQKLYNKIYGGLLQIEDTPTFKTSIDSVNATLSTVLFQLLNNDAWLKENSCVNINLSDYGLPANFENLDGLNGSSGSDAENIFNKLKKGYDNGSTIKFTLNEQGGAFLSNIEKLSTSDISSVNLLGFVGDSVAPQRYEVYRGILCTFTATDFSNSFSLMVYYDSSKNLYTIRCKHFESFGSAAYEDTSYFDKAGAATTAQNNSYAYANQKLTEAKQYTNSVLPTVSAGNNINVETTTDSNGKVNYKVSTTATVFNYKGNKTTIEELQAVQDSYSGDVWSVGAADSPGSSLYAWDGDEWINIGPADGLKSTNDTASHGVQLSNNSGEVNITVTPGSIVDGNDSVVTGGTVYSFVNEFKTSLGSAAYKDETYFDKAGTAASAVEDLENRLPTWDSGRGINIGRPDPYHGIFTYTISTTNEILRYLGDYTDSNPSFSSETKGDAYSKDGVLYGYITYQGYNVWKPIAGKKLDISTTYAQGGIRLSLDNSSLSLVTQHGEVGSPVDSYSRCWNYVTGATVHSYISSLHDSKTSTDGSHVNVTVSTNGGNVSSVSVTESDNLKNAVNNANSALQSVNVLGKALDKTTNAITVDEAKTYLGLGSAAYKDETYFDKAGAATAVENKLPGVTNGTGIEVSSSSDSNGKVTYTLSTNSEIIRYKGNVEKVNELGSGTEGDVYSVKNSLLYRYIGSGWSKIAGNIQEIDPTSRNGIALILNDDNSQGELSLSVTTGKVSSSKYGDGNKLVKGYDVYEALCAYTINDVKVNAEDSTYITIAKHKYSDSSYSYCEISLNETAIYSYVLDNIWEEFSLA